MFHLNGDLTDVVMPDKPCKDSDVLTMAFVNMQPLGEVYSLSEALSAGTLFPSINKPFSGGKQ